METPKKEEKAGRKAKSTTAQKTTTPAAETATPIDKTATANQSKGRGNAEQIKYSEVDQKCEAGTVGETGTYSEIEQIAIAKFKRFPDNTLYFTSDKNVFFKIKNAYRHAQRLSDKEIITIQRSRFFINN